MKQIQDHLAAGSEQLQNLLMLRRIGTAGRLLLQGDLALIRSLWRNRRPCLPKERLVLTLEPCHTDTDSAHQTVVRLAQCNEPLISVVVQSSVRQEATHSALRSIARHEPDLAFEIILVDDPMQKSLTELPQPLAGLIPTCGSAAENWATRCNEAAAQARGQYLCFVGPDLQIQAHAITALLQVFDKWPASALVGAKLVSPTCSLVDAGRIVWNDGSVEAYGRSDDPLEPEYNYVRKCDTVGDSLFMVPKSVWCDVGGFRPTFSTRTYAVADLAFRLRAINRDVYYQPRALAVDTSHTATRRGYSPSSAAVQDHSRRKFCAAWSRELADEALPVGTNVLHARERVAGRKTIVLIDHHVPLPDRDAGSRTIFQYLTLATDLGYNVKFLAQDFRYDPTYRGALERMGVEVLAGERFRVSWRAWFRAMSDRLHAVVFSRPNVTEMFLGTVIKACPSARRIYYGHDLHWIREEREYALTGDKAFAKSSREWRKRECRILEQMDCNMSISAEESRLVADLFPDCDHIVFPVFFWTDLSRLDVLPEGRVGYLFVGGFAHRPNVDGLLWFLDNVWPLVRRVIPEATVHIVGSNAPPRVTARTDAGLVFHGYVDDATLTALYRSARVAVVPLRYGAGVKGKTVEAMRQGLPIVSTGIGIEGLDALPETVTASDDAETFAGRAISLHEDRSLWERQVSDQYAFVRGGFSRERAVQCLTQAIEGTS